jgi:hypothetical protein
MSGSIRTGRPAVDDPGVRREGEVFTTPLRDVTRNVGPRSDVDRQTRQFLELNVLDQSRLIGKHRGHAKRIGALRGCRQRSGQDHRRHCEHFIRKSVPVQSCLRVISFHHVILQSPG